VWTRERPRCTPPGPAPGELVRVSETFRATSKSFTEVFRFRGPSGRQRDRRMNGADFATSQFADIFNTSSADVFVCHGC
jgi:hypothetical protein